jgi:hypothetical protein
VGKRKPITKRERVRLDRRTASRLLELNELPRRTTNRVLVDLSKDRGRVFRNASLKEKWVFASTAAGRAAEYSGTFDLFSDTADLANLQHCILRPKGKKIAIEDLAAGIKKLNQDYDKYVGKLVTEALIAPILCVLHVRFDEKLGLFDLHLHCVWRVAPKDLDAVLVGIQTKFFHTWDKKIKNCRALVNYITTWVVDHRALQRWPDTALLALWRLNRPKLIRPAGDFAAFRRPLKKDFRVVRVGLATKKVPVKKRKIRPRGKTVKHKHGDVLGIMHGKIAGEERRCAIVSATGSKRLSTKQVHDIVDEFAGRGHSSYSTSKTGPTPPGPGPCLPKAEKEPERSAASQIPAIPTPLPCSLPDWREMGSPRVAGSQSPAHSSSLPVVAVSLQPATTTALSRPGFENLVAKVAAIPFLKPTPSSGSVSTRSAPTTTMSTSSPPNQPRIHPSFLTRILRFTTGLLHEAQKYVWTIFRQNE